jgi:hypothetical protein
MGGERIFLCPVSGEYLTVGGELLSPPALRQEHLGPTPVLPRKRRAFEGPPP